jgi:3-mercaptopyruvate sulfurtransferase SseA
MKKGYRRVRPLDGGLEAWVAAGREIAVYEPMSGEREMS